MSALSLRAVLAAIGVGGVLAVGVVTSPTADALPCGGGGAFGSGGSRCDGPVRPDGSFERCESAYVLGFGGWNCFTVPAGAPGEFGPVLR